MAFSMSNIRGRLRGLSAVELLGGLAAIICAVLILQYLLGAFDGWKQAREFQRQVEAQQKIAAEEKQKREAAEREAAGWRQQAEGFKLEAAKQEGISNELREQIKPAIEELGRARAASAQSSQRYDQVRRAPRVVRPDDTPDRIGERLRAGAERFRQGND